MDEAKVPIKNVPQKLGYQVEGEWAQKPLFGNGDACKNNVCHICVKSYGVCANYSNTLTLAATADTATA